MLVKRGIPASPGVAIGPALVFGLQDFRIPAQFTTVDAVETEIIRLRCALENVCREITDQQILAEEELGPQYAAIFEAHLQMARDPKLIEDIESRIRKRRYSPEFAASLVLRKHARKLKGLGNAYLAERVTDIFDLEKNLLRHLLGEQREELSQLTAPVVVLAHDLTPSETAALNKRFVLGFAIEAGGPTSHTAILAGALEIPAVVGIGSFLTDVSGAEMVIIDGDRGEVIVDPDQACLTRYKESVARSKTLSERIRSQGGERSVTSDGIAIPVYGNIEFPEELETCRSRHADGIGLYRTEFLYLGSARERSENEHLHAYQQVIQTFPDGPVTIRTLDLGADKVPSRLKSYFNGEANPELGLRSIRLSLSDKDAFKIQLRAILRAAVDGDVRVMFPLISSLAELRQARMILRDVAEDLQEEGISCRANIPVGMMVEVPAAVIMADAFAREVDFFSIGTNDLIQYTLAADRGNPAVSRYYNASDPAILRMIQMVVTAAQRHNVRVTVCGQMSSDPKFIPVLVGLGVRELSATPQAIDRVKAVIRAISIDHAEAIAAKALELDVAAQVETYLQAELNKCCPDLVVH
ncbi:MAG: phosphoenolpyruvate--protein phosphotransferase [Planctomycetaceae bacterium]